MSRSKSRLAPALIACLALVALTASASAKNFKSSKTPALKHGAVAVKDAVALEITGPADTQAVAAYQQALASSGLQVKIHESKKGDKPLKVTAAVDKATDLSSFGKAVMTALPTKPGQMPPALEVMIYAPLTKNNSAQALAELEKVKGVDAKHSSVDVKKGSVRVRISGAEHVTAEDIMKAIGSAGVEPTLAKVGRAKKS